jgi:O-antigen/teichoic acid export membrane protein
MYKSYQIFLKNFSIHTLGLLLSGIISVFTVPLIINYYGIGSYGRFSLLQNVILVLISFGGGWLNQCVLRFNDYSTNFKFTIFHLYFITFFPLSLICFCILILINNGILIAILGSLAMLLGSFVALSITFYQSKFNVRISFYIDSVRVLMYLLMVVFFNFCSYYNTNIMNLILSFFFSFLMSFFVVLWLDFEFFKISLNLFFKSFSREEAIIFFRKNKYLFDYGWPLTLWFTSTSILNVCDRYIIDFFLTDDQLGIYSSIYDLIFKGVTLLYAPILVAGVPIITQKYNSGNKSEAFMFLKKLIFIELLIFLAIVAVAFYLRSFFLEKIVGLYVTEQTLALIYPIIFGAFIWQLAMLIHKPLELALKTKVMLLFSLIVMVINFLANVIFIPKYGILVAAYTTVLSALLYLLLCFFTIFLRMKNKQWSI